MFKDIITLAIVINVSICLVVMGLNINDAMTKQDCHYAKEYMERSEANGRYDSIHHDFYKENCIVH